MAEFTWNSENELQRYFAARVLERWVVRTRLHSIRTSRSCFSREATESRTCIRKCMDFISLDVETPRNNIVKKVLSSFWRNL